MVQIERNDEMATVASQLLAYEMVLQYILDEEIHKEVTHLIATNQLDELKRVLETWVNKKTAEQPASKATV